MTLSLRKCSGLIPLYAAVFISILPVLSLGEEVDHTRWLIVSNLLVKPRYIRECIYSTKANRPKLDKSGNLAAGEEVVSTYRIGHTDSDYFAFRFRNADEATNCTNALEGHGKAGNVLWRYGGGILYSEATFANSNSKEAHSEIDGWERLASVPLKLGMPMLEIGTVQFMTPTRFRAKDFNGYQVDASLRDGEGDHSNELTIAYQIAGFTNWMRTATLIWNPEETPSGNGSFPKRIVTKANEFVESDVTIERMLLTGETGPALDFSPEQIAGCKLTIVAHGTVKGDKVKVVDLGGKVLRTTTYFERPQSGRVRAYIILSLILLLSIYVLYAVAGRKRTNRQN